MNPTVYTKGGGFLHWLRDISLGFLKETLSHEAICNEKNTHDIAFHWSRIAGPKQGKYLSDPSNTLYRFTIRSNCKI